MWSAALLFPSLPTLTPHYPPTPGPLKHMIDFLEGQGREIPRLISAGLLLPPVSVSISFSTEPSSIWAEPRGCR